MKHVRINNANIEPVFFAYPHIDEIDEIVANVVKQPAEYDFVAPDGFGHHFWVIDDDKTIARITELFKGLKAFVGVPAEYADAELTAVPEAEYKNIKKGIELGEISKLLGATF